MASVIHLLLSPQKTINLDASQPLLQIAKLLAHCADQLDYFHFWAKSAPGATCLAEPTIYERHGEM